MRSRHLIRQHGRSEPLPANTFAESVTGQRTHLVWLMRPLPDLGEANLHLWRAYTGIETPVRVGTPQLGGESVTAAQVQIWHDPWQYRDRILRYRARCIQCGWLLWAADDGDNDPLGVLGDCTADASIDGPRLREITGIDAGFTSEWRIGLCYGCSNSQDQYRAARAKAITLWRGMAAGRWP